MTIKQQGGVFGRNPSFNDVEAEQVTTSSANIADLVVSNSSSFKGNMALRNSAGTQVAFIAPSLGGSFRLQGQSAEPMTFWINNVQVGEFNNSRDLKINNGNLVIGTSGKGIDFSATSGTGTSELFDDYEEGTWTPVVADAVTGGNVATLSVSNGYYTKVGNLVHVQAKITLSSKGSMSAVNPVYIRSLPFTSANSTNGATTFSILCNGAIITNYVTSLMDENATVFRLFDSGPSVNFIVVSEITDTTQFVIGGTYRSA